jgi:hypothetical protein
MAKQISENPGFRKRGSYAWKEWANGETWLLVRGEDYEVDTPNMRRIAYGYASRNGLKAHTMPSPDWQSLYVQFEKPKPKKKLILRKK